MKSKPFAQHVLHPLWLYLIIHMLHERSLTNCGVITFLSSWSSFDSVRKPQLIPIQQGLIHCSSNRCMFHEAPHPAIWYVLWCRWSYREHNFFACEDGLPSSWGDVSTCLLLNTAEHLESKRKRYRCWQSSILHRNLNNIEGRSMFQPSRICSETG